MNYRGDRHCGAIAFEVKGELKEVADCNCSICSRMGSLHWFVPRNKLRLPTPESNLATYTFGTATIRHYFCPKCGIHPFGKGTDPTHPTAAMAPSTTPSSKTPSPSPKPLSASPPPSSPVKFLRWAMSGGKARPQTISASSHA